MQPFRAVAALLLAGAPRRRPCPITGPIRRAALPVVASSRVRRRRRRRVCARPVVSSLSLRVRPSLAPALHSRGPRVVLVDNNMYASVRVYLLPPL